MVGCYSAVYRTVYRVARMVDCAVLRSTALALHGAGVAADTPAFAASIRAVAQSLSSASPAAAFDALAARGDTVLYLPCRSREGENGGKFSPKSACSLTFGKGTGSDKLLRRHSTKGGTCIVGYGTGALH